MATILSGGGDELKRSSSCRLRIKVDKMLIKTSEIQHQYTPMNHATVYYKAAFHVIGLLLYCSSTNNIIYDIMIDIANVCRDNGPFHQHFTNPHIPRKWSFFF